MKNETQSLGIRLSQKGSSYRIIQSSLIVMNKLSGDTSHSHYSHDLKQAKMSERFQMHAETEPYQTKASVKNAAIRDKSKKNFCTKFSIRKRN